MSNFQLWMLMFAIIFASAYRNHQGLLTILAVGYLVLAAFSLAIS